MEFYRAVFVLDDFGGYFDQISPPQVDRFGLGPRVPLLIISPFAQSGYVSHTVSEPLSLLKFVETRYHLRQSPLATAMLAPCSTVSTLVNRRSRR